METEEVRTPLPEELVERILAMVPFPRVFKARVLSKSWLAKFSSTAFLRDDDEEKKQHVTSFQNRMGECWSRTWKTFCPVHLGTDDLLAYDRECDHWWRMPSLSFLPKKHRSRLIGNICASEAKYELEGALVLIRSMSGRPSVANVLTGTWKDLPDCLAGLAASVSYLVNGTSSDTYKVILFYEVPLWFDVKKFKLARVYDSKIAAWTCKPIDLAEGFKYLSNRVSIQGVSYWVVGPMNTPRDLLSLDFDTQAFEVVQMQSTTDAMQADFVYLVVCNGTLVMVARDYEGIVSVVKIDLGSRTWLEVTTSGGRPAAPNFLFDSLPPASDGGDCIFFLGEEDDIEKIMAYDVTQDEWRYIPLPVTQFCRYIDKGYTWNSSPFQPGLNPFLAV